MVRILGISTKRSLALIFAVTFLFTGILSTSYINDVNAFTPSCKDTSLGATAVVNDNPPSITITWPKPSMTIANYEVYRKGLNDGSWGAIYKDVNGEDTSFTDTNVIPGIGYEYFISAINSIDTCTTYIYSGINLPATEYKGKVILLFDDSYTPYISNEVNTLVTDLTGDGWQVVRHNIPRTSKAPDVKALIKADYDADPTNVKSVFILGHVAIPKSGLIHPDGISHTARAFPADCYYGDMVGDWPSKNGVFTRDTIPNPIQLEVGRVDVYDMDIAYRNKALEAAEIKNYLEKDHNYRMKINPAPNTAFIDDYFLTNTLYGSNVWRNLGPILDKGYNSVTEGDWTTGLSDTAYSWGCITGFGSYSGIQNLKVTTSTILEKNFKVNFVMMLGSYFCEWDTYNSFLRAPLFMKDYGLESMWTGSPNWVIHQMGMGTDFGYGMKTTINNGYSNLYKPVDRGVAEVHISLMGDPTLRLFIIDPPTNQKLETISSNSNKLTWDASKDSVLGYYIYRADDANSQYTRITSQPVTATSYIDNSSPSADAKYMIKAVRLETTGSGSYYNLSQGAFAPLPVYPTPIPTAAPAINASIEQAITITPTPTPITSITASPTPIALPSSTQIPMPEDNISREEFTTLVIKALGIDTSNTDELNFADNDTISDWAKPYINDAVKNNIVSGYDDNTFKATANIQRSEIAAIVLRALGYSNLTNTETNFSDNSAIPSWAKKYVAKASEIGLMQGYSEGTNFVFKAEDLATRAECLSVIDKMTCVLQED